MAKNYRGAQDWVPTDPTLSTLDESAVVPQSMPAR